MPRPQDHQTSPGPSASYECSTGCGNAVRRAGGRCHSCAMRAVWASRHAAWAAQPRPECTRCHAPATYRRSQLCYSCYQALYRARQAAPLAAGSTAPLCTHCGERPIAIRRAGLCLTCYQAAHRHAIQHPSEALTEANRCPRCQERVITIRKAQLCYRCYQAVYRARHATPAAQAAGGSATG